MSNRSRMLLAGGFVAVVAIVAAVVVVSGDDDKNRKKPAASTTTSAPGVTTTTVTADTSSAVWPFASSSTRYDDPVDAARGFAAEYVGFTNPVVGEFRQGDARSGEVDVQPFADGPETTVLVRQLDDTWWVLGAATASIQVDEPVALSTVSSPVALSGTSTAFEATVSVEVQADGSTAAIGRGFVMGGANGEFGPFNGTLEFTTPAAAAGAVVFFTASAEDGSIIEVSVVRVRFA